MAQHNISWRLSRSFNAYLRCRGFRYSSLPITVRYFHERDDGIGSDDTIKKRTQDKDKVQDSSYATTLRIHRCGKEKVAQPVVKSVSSVNSHDSSTKPKNSHAKLEPGQTEHSNVVVVSSSKSVSCNKTGDKTFDSGTLNSANEQEEHSKSFEKFDFSRFEKVCEESSQYIKNLLNDAGANVPEKENNSSSHIQSFKIPSHEDVDRARAKQEALLNNTYPSGSIKESKTSSDMQVLSIPVHKDDHEKNIEHRYKMKSTPNTVESTMSAIKAADLMFKDTSYILQTQNEVSSSLADSNKQTLSAKSSRSVSETSDVVSDTVRGKPFKIPQNQSITSHKKHNDTDISKTKAFKDQCHTNLDLSQEETTDRSEDKRTVINLGNTVEPYVFSTDADNKNHKYKSFQGKFDGKTSKDKFKRSSGANMNEFDLEMRDYPSKVETSGRIYSSKKTDSGNDKNDIADNMEKNSPLSQFISSKFNEKVEFSASPSKVVYHKIGKDAPLRGTVAMLLEANSKIRSDQKPSGDTKMTPFNSLCNKSQNCGSKVIQSLPVIGSSKVDHMVSRYYADKYRHDSELDVKQKQLNTKDSRSTDIESKCDDIATLEEEFDRTIGSQILAESSNKDSDKEFAYKLSTKINPADRTLEFKKHDEKHKSTNNNKGGVISVTKNTIKSECDLTPGELYNSSSECGTNEHSLDNNTQNLKKVKFQSKKINRTASKYGKRPKSQQNIQSNNKSDLKTGKAGKSKSDINKLEENNVNETTNPKNIEYETHLTAGDLYNSKSQGEREYIRAEENMRKETDVKPVYRSKRLQTKDEMLKDRITSRSLKQKNTQYKAKVKVKSNLTSKDLTEELPSKKLEKRNIKRGLKSRDEIDFQSDMPEIRGANEVAQESTKKSRSDTQEENLKHAKLYISKAKRLHDIAKKKSIERKNRLRGGKGHKARRRKLRTSKNERNEKMTLSDYLYGLLVTKNDNKKGGGNHKNFATFSAARFPISIFKNWPLKRRSIKYNQNPSSPKNLDVFISPEVLKQGLGADAIYKERKDNERTRKKTELNTHKGTTKFESTRVELIKDKAMAWDGENNSGGHLVKYDGDNSHTKIRGGSLQEQRHKRRLKRLNSKNEDYDIQIRGGSKEVSDRGRTDIINQNNKRSFNTLSQHIWDSVRYLFPVSTKIFGK